MTKKEKKLSRKEIRETFNLLKEVARLVLKEEDEE